MVTKKFKLIATMVGLVAVLMMGLAMPGATQGFFSRSALVNALKTEISALLTAGASEAIDLDAAAFFSSRRATSAYIPPHSSALPGQLIKEYLRGKAEWVFLGAIYVSEDVPQVLPRGLYYLKAINRERVALINQEGEVVGTRWIKWLYEPGEAANLYESYGEGAYFVLTARTGGEPGTQYHYDGGGGGKSSWAAAASSTSTARSECREAKLDSNYRSLCANPLHRALCYIRRSSHLE